MYALQVLLVSLQAWAVVAAPHPKILVSRQKDTITTALGMVQGSLEGLDTAVKALSVSDPNSVAGVLTAAQASQSALDTATTMIDGADNLGLFAAIGLQGTADGLVTQVQTTLGDLSQKKPVFDQLGVTSVVADSLQQQKAGSTKLGDTLLTKVPAIAKPIAQMSTGQLGEALDSAIAVFNQPAAGGAAAAKPPAAA